MSLFLVYVILGGYRAVHARHLSCLRPHFSFCVDFRLGLFHFFCILAKISD